MKRTAIARSTKPLKKKRGTSTASLKRKATTLHSQYVRARDGCCQKCGTTSGQLQCAHIISRRYTSTRTYEWNAVCLCAGCHRRLTEHPHEHVAFFQNWCNQHNGPSFERLVERAYAGKDTIMRADYWRQEIVRLSGLLEGLSND